MPVPIPVIPFIRRRRPRAAAASAPPVALTLVAGEYLAAEALLRLTFDRAVDIAAMSYAAITVSDGLALGLTFKPVAGSGVLTDPATVQVSLEAVGPATTLQTVLFATDATGIAAADDGGTWAGATDLPLPFP